MTAILRWQAVAWWRLLLQADNAAKGGALIMAIAVAAASPRYWHQLGLAARELGGGSPGRLELILTALFVFWLFPQVGDDTLAISPHSLLRMPFSEARLFGIWVVSLLLSPVALLVTAASVLVWMPLGAGLHPWLGRLAAGAFFLASFGMGLLVAQSNDAPRLRKLAGLAAVVLAVAAAWRRTGLLDYLPARWVGGAVLGSGPWISLAALGGLAAACWGGAYLAFRQNLEGPRAGSAGTSTFLAAYSPPGRLGTLWKKDLVWQFRVLDWHRSLVVSVVFAAYFAGSVDASMDALWFGIGFAAVSSMGPAMNLFGLEGGPGVERLALLPVRGRDLLRQKDGVWLVCFVVVLLPMLVCGGYRFGMAAWAESMATVAAAAGLVLAWGNQMSVMYAERARVFRFMGSGPLLHNLVALVLALLPGVLAARGPGWGVPVVMLAAAVLWQISVQRAGDRLGYSWDWLRERLG
jgi:hypothetical protein